MLYTVQLKPSNREIAGYAIFLFSDFQKYFFSLPLTFYMCELKSKEIKCIYPPEFDFL